jgi:hypothetical protein
VSLLLGPDYLIYTAVSLLAHSLKKVDQSPSSSSSGLLHLLLVQRSGSFCPGDYLPFMDSLAAKYSDHIMAALLRNIAVHGT